MGRGCDFDVPRTQYPECSVQHGAAEAVEEDG